jgi:hypothetical protein
MKKILGVLIIFFSLSLHAHAGLIFNEIMYDLPGSDDGREWIEVANTGADPIDMTGWKLFENNTNHSLAVSQGSAAIPAGGFSIIADTPAKFLLDWPGFAGAIFDSAFSLSNAGESLVLKDSHGNSVDTIAYDISLGAGGDGNTLQRVSSGWGAKAGSPGAINEVPSAPPEEQTPPPADPSPPPDQGDTPPADQEHTDPVPPPPPEPPQGNEAGDQEHAQVIINEIMYDAPDSDDRHEWIEVENLGPSSADLIGWKLFENDTDHHLSLVQGNSSIAPAEFAVIADDAAAFLADHPGFSGTLFDSTFSLSNTGETIALKDSGAVIRDQATYDASLGAGGDGDTLQHFDAGFIAAQPTPGAMNILPSSSLPQGNDDSHVDPPLADVSINEVAWMGTTGNQYGEWLELYNDSDAAVDLSGWKLYKDGGQTLVFALTESIASKGYFIVERTTGTSLDPLPGINDESGTFGGGSFANLPAGEFLVLKDAYGRTIDSLDFSSGWPAGNNDTKETMQLLGGSWITATPTPDAVNATAPRASGGTPSSDSDVAPSLIETITIAADKTVPREIPSLLDDMLVLSLVIREDYRFVKIKNPTDAAVDLSSVKVVGSKTFVLPAGTSIAPGAEIVIENTSARFTDANQALWKDGEILIN